MSDSDISDDLATRLRKAQEKRERKHAATSSEDDESSVEAMSPSRKRKRSSTVKARLRRLDEKWQKQKLGKALEDDDSDDDIVVVDQRAKPTAKSAARTLVLSSDDEDTMTTPHGPKSLVRLKLNGADETALQELEKARNARQKLQRAQQHSGKQDVELEEARTHYHAATTKRVEYMTLLVCPRLDENAPGDPNRAKLPPQVAVYIASDLTVQNLIDSFLEQVNLNGDRCTVAFKLNGKRLDSKREISKYKALTNDSKIDATVYHSSIVSSRKAPAPTKKLGKKIVLKLRNETGDDTVEFHMKETFGELLAKYRSLKKLPRSKKISLEFDGEKLGSSGTPEMLDMEDKDIIEVRVR